MRTIKVKDEEGEIDERFELPEEAVKGLLSAIEDFKKGDYIILEKKE